MNAFQPTMEDEDNDRSDTDRYLGKYRGIVFNNIDPERRGRIQVIVPDVSTIIPTTWAMPCVPVAGLQMGFFAIPIKGSGVWIEFEQGDPDYPIWTGCFWGTAAEVPVTAGLVTPGAPAIVQETPLKHAIVLSDVAVPPMLAGGIMLKSGASSIVIGPDGVTITAPKIEINGVTMINKNALVVNL
jgi:hypothetical protein